MGVFVFFKEQTGSATEMTVNFGIRKILPNSEIRDFDFEPCGCSMNSVEEPVVSTIHITPEDGFSYANFETAVYNLKAINLNEMVMRVLACFQPTEFSLAEKLEKYYDLGDLKLGFGVDEVFSIYILMS